jgi:hypothetical protein
MLTRTWIALLLSEMAQGLAEIKAPSSAITAAQLRLQRWLQDTRMAVLVESSRREENRILSAGTRS